MSVALDIADGTALIRLDRPEKLNALDAAMIAALSDAADRIDADPTLRMAILTGAGRAFCVGGDVAAWSALDPIAMGQRWVREGHRVFDKLARLRVPLIAVLNGPALGGGMELAGLADRRIAEAGAVLGLPETGIGMVPGWSGTQRLVRRFGAGPVRRMALFGERFDADAAYRVGLVDEVVGAGEGLARARGLATEAAARGRLAAILAKQMINAAETEEGGAVLEMLAASVVSGTAELAEGVAAFRERRKPRFD
ncbi:MAG TPA: enoyl-CoA hydratase/isomerase family protein [Acetobacteraceae bacterium]|nr:enoyl-CoA hydratase/isomerase family protein [Acetobacteraceae bacterium]